MGGWKCTLTTTIPSPAAYAAHFEHQVVEDSQHQTTR
jgi:hypothetical protein